MNLEELQDAARQAFERFDGSQSDLGELIGVDRAAISRAVRKQGLAHASVQARIVSHVEGVPVRRRSTYRGDTVDHEWVRLDPSPSLFERLFLITTGKDRG